MKLETNARRVGYVNLAAQFEQEQKEVLSCIEAVFRRGQFIGGASVEKFEYDLAEYLGAPNVVAVNSGTDALILSMRALGLGPGDEVITPPNSFVASTAAIVAVGATPVFADVQPDQNISPAAIEAAVTPRTRAVMPVHLTGRVCDMHAIMKIAAKHGLAVIEDSAQSIGSTIDGQMSGTFGDAGCFSCHPLKNLNASGDGGFVVMKDEVLAAKLRRVRNHGLIDRDHVVEWGTVSRLDAMKAEVLRIRLRRLPEVIAGRRRNAEQYREELASLPVFMPPCRQIEFNTFHTFVIQVERRDELRKFLTDRGIETAVHYPIPIHLQKAAEGLGHGRGSFPMSERQAQQILTLPIHQFLSSDDISYICANIREFWK